MKKIILVFITLILLTACNKSRKGAWTKADKEKFKVEMDEVSELNTLGENKQAFIECYLEKVEANYESLADADKDTGGCTPLAKDCMRSLMKNNSSNNEETAVDTTAVY